MGRAFLSSQYLAPSPPPPTFKATSAPHRWAAKAFDPDQEDIDGLDMVYEAVVDPSAAAAAVPESAVRTPLTVASVALMRDNANSDDNATDSDSASTVVSSPSSASSTEAQQLAALQRRLFGGESRSRTRASTGPSAGAGAHAQLMLDHLENISSFDRVAGAPRRAQTLFTLEPVTRPAVAQPI